MQRLVDRGYRVAYRIAFPIARVVWRHYRRDGVMMAVWVGDRLLVVRHSYRPGLSIPGGGVKSGEDRAHAASRELREEVGIDVPAAAWMPVLSGRVGRDRGWYETDLAVEPRLTIDRREIIYAAFLPAADIIAAGCDPYFKTYLGRARP